MVSLHGRRKSHSQSLPSRGAWIEIPILLTNRLQAVSLPSRGAWIEIAMVYYLPSNSQVAPLTGSVD